MIRNIIKNCCLVFDPVFRYFCSGGLHEKFFGSPVTVAMKDIRKPTAQLVTAIAVSVLLGACSTPSIIPADTITFQTGDGVALSKRPRMTLVLDPDETPKVKMPFLPIGGAKGLRSVQIRVDAAWPSAAQKVFNRVALISEDTTFAPHLIAHVMPDAGFKLLNSFDVHASVDLYWGTGEFIGTFDAGYRILTGLLPHTIHNGYVKVFVSIVEQILADESLAQYFRRGFDDSLASTTPNIPQLPYLSERVRAETNRRDSEAILVKARSRGYALASELDSVLSLGPDPSHLDALVLESLLPFSREMYQALEQDDLRRVQTVSRQWRSWLKRSLPYVEQEAEDNLQKQLAQLDKLDRQFGDPVLRELTMKFTRAIKQERWEDAKNIQELIRGMQTLTPAVAASPVPTQSIDTHTGKECANAKRDYKQAVVAYNNAKSNRRSGRGGQALGALGSIKGNPKDAGLWGLFAGVNRTEANDSQADMNHALRLMQDAKGRVTILCTN